MTTGHVFVSYSHPDQACAFEIVAALEERGIAVWVAPRDVSPASDWAAEIIDAIARARLMVLVFSGHCNTSPQVRREVERAVNRDLPVLPFRIESVVPTKSLEYFLSTQHWLDAFPAPLEPHYRRLANHVQSLCATTVSSRPTCQLDAARLRLLVTQLAVHVGPISSILVARALRLAAHRQDLIERLAQEIEHEPERQAFVAACRSAIFE